MVDDNEKSPPARMLKERISANTNIIVQGSSAVALEGGAAVGGNVSGDIVIADQTANNYQVFETSKIAVALFTIPAPVVDFIDGRC